MNVSVTNVAELSPDSLHWGVLRLCRGLDIENLIKTPLIYSVSYFNFWGLGALFLGG